MFSLPQIPIDHPLTSWFEGGTVVASVAVFFILHRRPAVVTSILGVTPFVILANLIARLFHQQYVGTTDIPMWGCVFFSYMSTVYYSFLNPKAYKTDQPDAYDRWQWPAIGLATVGVLVLMIFYSIDQYGERQTLALSGKETYQRGYTKAVADQKKRDSLAVVVADSVKVALRTQKVKDSLWHEYVRVKFNQLSSGINGATQAARQRPKPARSQVIILNTAPKGATFTAPPALNREIKPLPAKLDIPKRGNKTSYVSERDSLNKTEPDSSYFARMNNH